MSPGGWVELQDALWEVYEAAPGSALQRFFQVATAGAAAAGRDLNKCRFYKDYLDNAGFVDVIERRVSVPASPWPQERRQRRIGYYCATAIGQASDSARRFLRLAGMTSEEIDGLLAELQKDVLKTTTHQPYVIM
jgi:hypothetical protein